MKDFTPDYNNLVLAARNKETSRTPLYEHGISFGVLEKASGIKIINEEKTRADRREELAAYCLALKKLGYDAVTYERCITQILEGGGALANHIEPVIKTRADFEKYPFDKITERYVEAFDELFGLLGEVMPDGMKAVGGVGNGVFEIAQDLAGYENLMLLSYDDPELYADIFNKVGEAMYRTWEWFLPRHGDAYCVFRFGDDLGYKSNTLLPHDDIRRYIIPQYKKIVGLIHSYNKPFLLHSCGCIFDVFDDIIREVKIDAKHSNEDQIADFRVWVDRYGDRIGNFGGIDTDWLVRKSDDDIKKKVVETMRYCSRGHGGFALGSGNSIPDYVDPDKWLTMINAAREERGDFR